MSARQAAPMATDPASGILYGFNGQPHVVGSDDAITKLQDTLSQAHQESNEALAATTSATLGQIYIGQFNMADAQPRLDEAVRYFKANRDADRSQYAMLAGLLAISENYLGNASEAAAAALEAVQSASSTGLSVLQGYAQCNLGAVLCYCGDYGQANEVFAEARSLLSGGDTFAAAWWQFMVAREYCRERGQLDQAVESLRAALAVFQAQAEPPFVIECLLSLADSLLRQGEIGQVGALLAQADKLIKERKRPWYRPESCLLKAQLAFAEGDAKRTASEASAGLSAVGDGGDFRLLTPLYRILAVALEKDRTRLDDAYDALERAVRVGRVRARKVDLALALYQTGIHIKRFASRPTLRARGSGFLFEADSMFKSMQIEPPPAG